MEEGPASLKAAGEASDLHPVGGQRIPWGLPWRRWGIHGGAAFPGAWPPPQTAQDKVSSPHTCCSFCKVRLSSPGSVLVMFCARRRAPGPPDTPTAGHVPGSRGGAGLAVGLGAQWALKGNSCYYYYRKLIAYNILQLRSCRRKTMPFPQNLKGKKIFTEVLAVVPEPVWIHLSLFLCVKNSMF